MQGIKMAERLKHKSRIHERLNNPDLRCKKGCGFYGNPAWQGYCSVCYREVYIKHHKVADSKVHADDVQTHSEESLKDRQLKFNKFEEKKKIKTESKKESVKKLFKKKHLGESSPSSTASALPTRTKVVLDFREFLKTLKKPAAQDVSDQCKNFVSKLYQGKTLTVHQQSELVQDFYATMADRLESHSVFKGQPQEILDSTLSNIEKYIMTKLYKIVFCPASTDDEEKDLALQRRIRSFHWIKPQQLDAEVDETNEEVVELLQDAQHDLVEINTKRAPQDKLNYIVRCCKKIFKIINMSTPSGGAVSADDFLPCLIYIILKANPTMLHSNIQYISRFCNPNKLTTGEAGYFFTNLCCVVTFIDKLDAQALSMTEAEFSRYMNGDSGPDSQDSTDKGDPEPPVTCKGLELMKENLELLEKLHERQNKLKQDALKLNNHMAEFRVNIAKEVDAIIAGTSDGTMYLKRPNPVSPVETPTRLLEASTSGLPALEIKAS